MRAEDLLLLAKTEIRKSFKFKLLRFMTLLTGVVTVLMRMNLLEGEQCEMINWLQSGESIVLNGENGEKISNSASQHCHRKLYARIHEP